MTFFNQKEEVIEIELTQYGKHLLSRGKLKPVYYAFFDDDIIYDAKYAGVEENNGTAVDRIKSVPRPKVQYVFTGIEEQVKKNLELIKSGKETLDSLKLIPTTDKHHVLNNRIGTSYLGDNKVASLNITMLNGEIESTTLLQSGSLDSSPLIKTPLLQLKDIDYILSEKRAGSEAPTSEEVIYISRYSDGTSVALEEDYLLIEILEKNVENEMKNFDIEMFICENNESTGEENYIPLHFDQAYEDYKNGILLDPQVVEEQEGFSLQRQKDGDQFRVENFFNILIDNEIEKNLICQLINNMKDNNKLYDPMYDCAEYNEQNAAQQKRMNEMTSGDLYSPSYNEDEVKKC
jgi:hypothetical protein